MGRNTKKTTAMEATNSCRQRKLPTNTFRETIAVGDIPIGRPKGIQSKAFLEMKKFVENDEITC